MAEFTKGEWKARHPVNNDYTIYTGEYGQGITRIAILFESSPNAEANAHLIAAAPKMYEALKKAIPYLPSPPLQDAIEALARAEVKE